MSLLSCSGQLDMGPPEHHAGHWEASAGVSRADE